MVTIQKGTSFAPRSHQVPITFLVRVYFISLFLICAGTLADLILYRPCGGIFSDLITYGSHGEILADLILYRSYVCNSSHRECTGATALSYPANYFATNIYLWLLVVLFLLHDDS